MKKQSAMIRKKWDIKIGSRQNVICGGNCQASSSIAIDAGESFLERLKVSLLFTLCYIDAVKKCT